VTTGSSEETDDPLYADRRNFYKVEKWSSALSSCCLLGTVSPRRTASSSVLYRENVQWQPCSLDTQYRTTRLGGRSYDDFAPVQKAKGVMAQAVYQAADNTNDITVTHEFGSVEAAQAFAKSDELKKAMQGAGVVSAPTIWFTNRV
jgi:hypothetical protein